MLHYVALRGKSLRRYGFLGENSVSLSVKKRLVMESKEGDSQAQSKTKIKKKIVIKPSENKKLST